MAAPALEGGATVRLNQRRSWAVELPTRLQVEALDTAILIARIEAIPRSSTPGALDDGIEFSVAWRPMPARNNEGLTSVLAIDARRGANPVPANPARTRVPPNRNGRVPQCLRGSQVVKPTFRLTQACSRQQPRPVPRQSVRFPLELLSVFFGLQHLPWLPLCDALLSPFLIPQDSSTWKTSWCAVWKVRPV